MLGPKLLVVDMDAGADDAWALLALLRATRLGLVRILAVIAAAGNTNIDHVTQNACRTLQLANAKHVPVYRGAVDIESQRNVSEIGFYGVDGFGDLNSDWSPDMSQLQAQDGIEALYNLTIQYPGEISLVCLAPLTNIAEAIKRYPNITSNLKEIFIMGGNYSDDGQGSAEFNFANDAESANTVLARAECPITLLPLEPSLQPNFSIDWRLASFKHAESAAIQMLNQVEGKCYKAHPDDKMWWACDPILACAVYNESVVQETISVYARVELDGPQKGQVIIEPAKNQNVKIITKVNNDVVKREILQIAQVDYPKNLKT